MGKILFILGLLLLFLPIVHAVKSEDFINTHSKTIFDDCKGYDIHIKKGIVVNAKTKEKITEISWPNYNYENIITILTIVSEKGSYKLKQGKDIRTVCKGNGITISGGGEKDGCELLSCGSNILDISKDEYFWNGIKLEESRYIEKKTYFFENLFAITIFGVSIINISLFAITLIAISIIIKFKKRIMNYFISTKIYKNLFVNIDQKKIIINKPKNK